MSVARIRRRWMRGVVASVAMLGIGAGGVAVAHDRMQRRELWRSVRGDGELWRRVDASMKEERRARFDGEPRAEGFADEQERWVRGPLQVSIERALPGVVLEHVECRETMCRWSYRVPDEVSGYALMFAPWGDPLGNSSLSYGEVRRASVLAVMPVVRDGAMVAWFDGLRSDGMRRLFVEHRRFDPEAMEMIEAWARDHDRR